MSTLQNAAKPLLTPMIIGGEANLSEQDQTILISWALMTTMVFELADPITAVLSVDQRKEFYLNRTIPNYTSTYIGRADTSERTAYWHWGLGSYIDEPGVKMFDLEQSTTFSIGAMLVHTMTGQRSMEALSAPEAFKLGLKRLGYAAVQSSFPFHNATPMRITQVGVAVRRLVGLDDEYEPTTHEAVPSSGWN